MLQVDPALHSAALAGLETMINGALSYDPGTKRALAKLEGQILAVEITAPKMNLFIAPDEDGVRLMGTWEGDVSTRMRGPLPALLQLAASPTTSLADSGVEVLGSTSLLNNLRYIAGNMEIDWEEALSKLVGDVAAHEAAGQMRAGVRWLQDRMSSGQRLVSEYLTEEMKTVPTKPELDAFSGQIDELRMGADRLAQRFEAVNRLLQERQADLATKPKS